MEVGGEAGLALALLAKNYYNREINKGRYFNGRIGVSKTLDEGSIPSRPADYWLYPHLYSSYNIKVQFKEVYFPGIVSKTKIQPILT